MSKDKSTMKKIRTLFRKFDIFGESFTFRYKNEDKHSTVFGGIICFLFYFIAFFVFVKSWKQFDKDRNYSLKYYAVNLDTTETINFTNNDSIAFAFGLSVKEEEGSPNLNDLFNITVQYIKRTRNKSGETKNIQKNVFYHNCLIKDFPKGARKSYYDLKINEYFCLDKNELPDNYSIKGIYTEKEFSYFSISVKSKYTNNKTHYDIIEKAITKYDCKLKFYYVDLSSDLLDYYRTDSYFTNLMFLQLNPTLVQKRNIFYVNYYLIEDSSFLRNIKEEQETKIMTGLSRVEDYAEYKGLQRTYEETGDNGTYATIYIRADNKKIYVKKIYQDFMEFYADTTGLLVSIFWILEIIIAKYDRVQNNYSISKRLFYFEGIKENKFDQFKIIKELLNSKEELEKNKQIQENTHISTFNRTNIISNTASNADSNVDSRNIAFRNNYIRRNTNSQIKENIKEKIKEKDLIDYSSYNILEMIGSLKLCFCKTKKFKNKINLINQANNIIDDKLDIVFYIRNMILFELIRPSINLKEPKKSEKKEKEINDIDTNASLELFGEKEEPKIDEKKDVEIMKYFEGELYKKSYRLNSNVLNEKIVNLILHPGKTKTQKKIIYFLEDHLKGV